MLVHAYNCLNLSFYIIVVGNCLLFVAIHFMQLFLSFQIYSGYYGLRSQYKPQEKQPSMSINVVGPI